MDGEGPLEKSEQWIILTESRKGSAVVEIITSDI